MHWLWSCCLLSYILGEDEVTAVLTAEYEWEEWSSSCVKDDPYIATVLVFTPTCSFSLFYTLFTRLCTRSLQILSPYMIIIFYPRHHTTQIARNSHHHPHHDFSYLLTLSTLFFSLPYRRDDDDDAGKSWAKNNNRPPWRFHDYSADINWWQVFLSLSLHLLVLLLQYWPSVQMFKLTWKSCKESVYMHEEGVVVEWRLGRMCKNLLPCRHETTPDFSLPRLIFSAPSLLILLSLPLRCCYGS